MGALPLPDDSVSMLCAQVYEHVPQHERDEGFGGYRARRYLFSAVLIGCPLRISLKLPFIHWLPFIARRLAERTVVRRWIPLPAQLY